MDGSAGTSGSEDEAGVAEDRRRAMADEAVTPRPSGRSAGGMQLVSRVAAVLRALEGRSTGLSLGQIAKATALPRATVQRIVDALEVEQLVTADPAQGGVRLGAAFVRMAAAAYMDFRSLARPYLEALSRELCETVVLTVLRDWRAVFVDQVIADRPMQVTTRPGTELLLHSTAAGKALLATLPEDMLRHLAGGVLEQCTARTIVRADELIPQVVEVARTGLAYDLEESAEGVCAIAAPVRDAAGTAYSISIPVPTPRFAPSLKALEAGLERCRRQIEAAAGTAAHLCGRPAAG